MIRPWVLCPTELSPSSLPTSRARRGSWATTTIALGEYEPYVERVRGAIFDGARERGRLLSLEEAVAHALTHGPSL